MRIAASVTLLSLLLGFPLAYFMSFHAPARKDLLYQLVIVPLWVSYLVRGYAWRTILGSDGVLNGFLQYLHITKEPVSFFLYSPGKSLFRRLVLLPLVLPGIITGLSLLMLAVSAGLQLSLLTVFLGLGTALISVATTELFAGLQKMDRAQEEASLDLGATPWQTFWRITLPSLKLSLIAAGLLIFTLSMDEIAVTFFLIGRDNTLPLEIWARLHRGITPEINAISTLIFVVSVILILIWYHIRARTIGKEARELLERP